MGINPTNDLASPLPPLTSSSKKNAKRSSENESRITPEAMAERDASTAIAQQRERVREAQQETEWELAQVKDQYEKRYTKESDDIDQNLSNQRVKGYEQLLALKRQQQAEIDRVRRQGEKDLAESRFFYDHQILDTEEQGRQKLDQLQKQYAALTAYQQNKDAEELKLEHITHAGRIEAMQHEHEQTFQALKSGTEHDYERLKNNTQKSLETAKQQFDNRFQQTIDDQTQTLNHVNQTAGHKLSQIRQDTSRKLAAYSNRQNDPFYQMLDSKAQLNETDDAYILTAQIPEHERDNVIVNVHGDHLTLSGTRRNSEELTVEPGHTRGTHSYQSFSETFPLTWPVNPKLLSKQFDGDQLVVRIPKKLGPAPYEPYKAGQNNPAIKRYTPEQPQFPSNLPLGQTKEVKVDEEDGKTSPPSPGSRPLG